MSKDSQFKESIRPLPELSKMMPSYLPTPSPLAVAENLAYNWKKFKQNFMIYVTATGLLIKLEQEAQMADLKLLVGEGGIEIFNILNITENEAKSLDVILKKFNEYCIAKKNLVFECFVFNSRQQKDGESFELFVKDLRQLVKSCDYGAAEDSILRD